MYKGKWSGTTWIYLPGGSYLTGQADFFGHLTGDNIACLYPDLKHTINGTFTKSKLSVGQFCYVSTVRFIRGHLPELTFTPCQGPMFNFDPGNSEIMCKEPLLPDPYENNNVCVKVSKMKGGGEGLFAKVDLPAKKIVSYYNGVKSTEIEIVSKQDRKI